MKYVDGYVCALGNQALCWQSSLSISDWAAWVQALGSVGAIGAAAMVMWWQHHLQIDTDERRALEQEAASLLLIVDVMRTAADRLKHAHASIGTFETSRTYFAHMFEAAEFDLIQAALVAGRAPPMSSAKLTLAFLSAEAAVGTACSLLRNLQMRVSSLGGFEHVQPLVAGEVNRLVKGMEIIENRVHECHLLLKRR